MVAGHFGSGRSILPTGTLFPRLSSVTVYHPRMNGIAPTEHHSTPLIPGNPCAEYTGAEVRNGLEKERDLLIAQTLAFVQSVAGKKAGVDAIADEIPDTEPHVEAAATEIRDIFDRPLPAARHGALVLEPPKDVQLSAHIPRGLRQTTSEPKYRPGS